MAKRVYPDPPADKNGARHWCLTIFVRGDKLVVNEENATLHDLRYAVGQAELCPETSKRHWQVYVEFKKPVKGVTCRKIFSTLRGDSGQLRQRELEPEQIHWERRRGSREQAREYCKKQESRSPDGERLEWGTAHGSHCWGTYCPVSSHCPEHEDAMFTLWYHDEIDMEWCREDRDPHYTMFEEDWDFVSVAVPKLIIKL